MSAQELYRRAERRIRKLYPDDEEAVAFALADWPEGEEHLRWLLTAPAEEIDSWIAAGSR